MVGWYVSSPFDNTCKILISLSPTNRNLVTSAWACMDRHVYYLATNLQILNYVLKQKISHRMKRRIHCSIIKCKTKKKKKKKKENDDISLVASVVGMATYYFYSVVSFYL